MRTSFEFIWKVYSFYAAGQDAIGCLWLPPNASGCLFTIGLAFSSRVSLSILNGCGGRVSAIGAVIWSVLAYGVVDFSIVIGDSIVGRKVHGVALSKSV